MIVDGDRYNFPVFYGDSWLTQARNISQWIAHHGYQICTFTYCQGADLP
ncbi:hypothetical protein KFU94_20620 [Chloroflexi bacterium TSY]|nr:hypothetical protein [Chloroflexi bacterium TSY]